MDRAREAMENGIEPDLIEIDLLSAHDHLKEILGEVHREDLLDTPVYQFLSGQIRKTPARSTFSCYFISTLSASAPIVLREAAYMSDTTRLFHEVVMDLAAFSMYLLELMSIILIVFTTVSAFFKLFRHERYDPRLSASWPVSWSDLQAGCRNSCERSQRRP